MTSGSIFFAVCTAAVALVCGFAYRRVWARLRGPEITPTGFGALLAPILLGAALATGASLPMQVALGIVTAATAAYWIDDAFGLSARLRLLISFAAGVAIGMAYFADHGGFSLVAVGLLCLAAGLTCVIMTNVVNFYDGADLNLATFIALTAGLILLCGPAQREWTSLALAVLAFTIPFAAMNSRPKTIYLGDSGSFAFAGLLTIMATAFVRNIESVPPEAAIPAALPTFDVLFVFVVRVVEGQDLLTRHYLQLFQRLQKRHGGFGYLLPQIVNAALCLLAAAALQAAGLGRILSVTAAMLVVTIPFYFACRKIFPDKWERFCIVGVGGHARTKLIPALLANRRQIAGLVSGQRPEALPCGPVFATLEEAVARLPADTAFVLATPPSLHFEQACTALAAGRDVIVEKPGFVTERDVREIARRCEAADLVLVEGFMHRHTLLFERLLAFWETDRDRIRSLAIEFVVPSLPAGTFRQAGTIDSSSLYDIGCYGLSLLADLNLPLDGLHLAQGGEVIDLAGCLDGIDVTLRIGVAETYENKVELGTDDGAVTQFSPFFYGRPADKRIETRRNGTVEEEAFADANGFEAMFEIPRAAWRASQEARLERMIRVTRRLEELGADLAAWRRRAG